MIVFEVRNLYNLSLRPEETLKSKSLIRKITKDEFEDVWAVTALGEVLKVGK